MIVAIERQTGGNDALPDGARRRVFHLMIAMKEAAQKISRVTAKLGVKGAPSSRPPGQALVKPSQARGDPGERRARLMFFSIATPPKPVRKDGRLSTPYGGSR